MRLLSKNQHVALWQVKAIINACGTDKINLAQGIIIITNQNKINKNGIHK